MTLQAGQLMGFWSGGGEPTVAPSYDSAGAASFVTATPVAPAYPTVASGDMLIMVAGITHSATAPSITAPAGWTLVPGATAADTVGTDLNCIALFYKQADGTESGTINVTVTMSGANNVAGARIFRFLNSSGIEGGNSSSSWNSSLKDPCLGNYGDWDGVDVTITGAKRMIVQGIIYNNDFTSGVAVPSGFSSSVNASSTLGSDASIAMTYRALDVSFTASSYEVISSAGNVTQDQGAGLTAGLALIGV